MLKDFAGAMGAGVAVEVLIEREAWGVGAGICFPGWPATGPNVFSRSERVMVLKDEPDAASSFVVST